MATPMPPARGPRAPATPPPDLDVLPKAPMPAQPLRTFAQDLPALMPWPMSSTVPQGAAAAAVPSATAPIAPASSGLGLPSGLDHAASHARYIAMLSQIHSYYRQRCFAVANYQQQHYQASANAYRAECRETMQSAMMVVATYVRDRIARKRRRARRRLRRGLAEQGARRPAVTKGESIRRWVVEVEHDRPSMPVAVEGWTRHRDDGCAQETFPPPEVPWDREEVDFSMDQRAVSKDTKLLDIANNLILSQPPAEVELPLFGALSLGESESDSESDDEDSGRTTTGGDDVLGDEDDEFTQEEVAEAETP